MAENKAGIAFAGAGLAALATYLLIRPASAAPLPPPEGMDEETWRLVQTIGDGIIDQSRKLDAIVSAINNLTVGLGGQVTIQNPRSTTAVPVLCAVAGQGYQFPSRVVPWNKTVAVKALSTNVNLVYVAETRQAAQSNNSSWPLIANEGVGYMIQNTDTLWVRAVLAGEGIVFTVEQE